MGQPQSLSPTSAAAVRAILAAFRRLPPQSAAVETLDASAAMVREIAEVMTELLRARPDISPRAYRSLVHEQCLVGLQACARYERAMRTIAPPAFLDLHDKLTALDKLLEASAEEAAVAAAPDDDVSARSAPAMPTESGDVVYVD